MTTTSMVGLHTETDTSLSLFCLLLRERLQCALATPEGQQRAARLKGSLSLKADGMHCRIHFEGGAIHLSQGGSTRADARLSGSLASFVALCQDKAKLLGFVRQQMKVRGNPIFLMKVLPLLRFPHASSQR